MFRTITRFLLILLIAPLVSDLPKSGNSWMGGNDAAPQGSSSDGLLYHVMAHGNDGQKIFLSKSGRSTIRLSSRRFGPCVTSLYAYVLEII